MNAIAFLGPAGTFSGILARKRFGRRAILLPCPTIEAVFDSVVGEKANLGLVPVENSSGGTVHDTIDLLIRHAGLVFVREEISLDIRIALLGRPNVPLRTVFSHFTQIKHHSQWLKDRHPRARLIPVESTAVAAQRAAATRGAAALASPGAAELYDLKVLEFPGGGEPVNVTHFFVISRDSAAVAGAERTALVAALRNECGSLHKFLGPFARGQVSLTRIVSRPVPGQPQTYVFYVEIEGESADPGVARALSNAGRIARSLVSLGAFSIGRRFRS
jgi:prephenate dehydratase